MATRSPQSLNQVPPGAQQLTRLVSGYTPHLGQGVGVVVVGDGSGSGGDVVVDDDDGGGVDSDVVVALFIVVALVVFTTHSLREMVPGDLENIPPLTALDRTHSLPQSTRLNDVAPSNM